jgi:hypothetical protein
MNENINNIGILHQLDLSKFAMVRFQVRIYNKRRINKIRWFGLPCWPFLVFGEFYRCTNGFTDKLLPNWLRNSEVLKYFENEDLYIMGRLPWWKNKKWEM